MEPQEVLGLIGNVQELSAQYVNPHSATILEWLAWGVENLPRWAGEAWALIKGLIAVGQTIVGV